MGKLIYEDEEIEVPDGEKIHEAAEEIGVPFGCKNGQCQACLVTVLEGAENLSELTEEEKEAGMEDNQRLACQAVIKSGDVKIEF